MATISIFIPTTKYTELKQTFCEGNPVVIHKYFNFTELTVLTYNLDFFIKNIDRFNLDYVRVCRFCSSQWHSINLEDYAYGSMMLVESNIIDYCIDHTTPEFVAFIIPRTYTNYSCNFLSASIRNKSMWNVTSKFYYEVKNGNKKHTEIIQDLMTHGKQDNTFEQYLDFVNNTGIVYSQVQEFNATYGISCCITHSNYRTLKHHLAHIVNTIGIFCINLKMNYLLLMALEREYFEFADLLIEFYDQMKGKIICEKNEERVINLSIKSLEYIHNIIDRYEFSYEIMYSLLKFSLFNMKYVEFTYLSTIYPLIAIEVIHEIEMLMIPSENVRDIIDELKLDNDVLMDMTYEKIDTQTVRTAI